MASGDPRGGIDDPLLTPTVCTAVSIAHDSLKEPWDAHEGVHTKAYVGANVAIVSRGTETVFTAFGPGTPWLCLLHDHVPSKVRIRSTLPNGYGVRMAVLKGDKTPNDFGPDDFEEVWLAPGAGDDDRNTVPAGAYFTVSTPEKRTPAGAVNVPPKVLAQQRSFVAFVATAEYEDTGGRSYQRLSSRDTTVQSVLWGPSTRDAVATCAVKRKRCEELHDRGHAGSTWKK